MSTKILKFKSGQFYAFSAFFVLKRPYMDFHWIIYLNCENFYQNESFFQTVKLKLILKKVFFKTRSLFSHIQISWLFFSNSELLAIFCCKNCALLTFFPDIPSLSKTSGNLGFANQAQNNSVLTQQASIMQFFIDTNNKLLH